MYDQEDLLIDWMLAMMEGQKLRVTPKFLVWAYGWLLRPFVFRGRTGRDEGWVQQEWVWEQEKIKSSILHILTLGFPCVSNYSIICSQLYSKIYESGAQRKGQEWRYRSGSINMVMICKVLGSDEVTSGESSHRDERMTQSSNRGRVSYLHDRK